MTHQIIAFFDGHQTQTQVVKEACGGYVVQLWRRSQTMKGRFMHTRATDIFTRALPEAMEKAQKEAK